AASGVSSGGEEVTELSGSGGGAGCSSNLGRGGPISTAALGSGLARAAGAHGKAAPQRVHRAGCMCVICKQSRREARYARRVAGQGAAAAAAAARGAAADGGDGANRGAGNHSGGTAAAGVTPVPRIRMGKQAYVPAVPQLVRGPMWHGFWTMPPTRCFTPSEYAALRAAEAAAAEAADAAAAAERAREAREREAARGLAARAVAMGAAAMAAARDGATATATAVLSSGPGMEPAAVAQTKMELCNVVPLGPSDCSTLLAKREPLDMSPEGCTAVGPLLSHRADNAPGYVVAASRVDVVHAAATATATAAITSITSAAAEQLAVSHLEALLAAAAIAGGGGSGVRAGTFGGAAAVNGGDGALADTPLFAREGVPLSDADAGGGSGAAAGMVLGSSSIVPAGDITDIDSEEVEEEEEVEEDNLQRQRQQQLQLQLQGKHREEERELARQEEEQQPRAGGALADLDTASTDMNLVKVATGGGNSGPVPASLLPPLPPASATDPPQGAGGLAPSTGPSPHKRRKKAVRWEERLAAALRSERSRITFGKSGVHGWGIFAKVDIPQDSVVTEFRGEVVRPVLADLRERRYRAQGRDCFLFHVNGEVVLDSTHLGHYGRFSNHSCSPSMYTKVLEFEGGGVRLVFLARTDIKAGQELTFDYRFKEEDTDDKVPCRCGAPNCKGTLN
ncbi:hypothetical protein VaNZ11_000489, partial [Volvox africanus]